MVPWSVRGEPEGRGGADGYLPLGRRRSVTGDKWNERSAADYGAITGPGPWLNYAPESLYNLGTGF